MIKTLEKLSTKFTKLVNNSLSFSIFSQSPCLLCSDASDRTLKFCDACLNDLPWNRNYCVQCALPIKLETTKTDQTLKLRCGECISNPPPFTRSMIPFSYEFPVNALLQNIKYQNQGYYTEPLCRQFLRFQKQARTDFYLPDYLIAVPLHKNKLKKRGFNQASLIARHLSKHLAIPELGNTLYKCKESRAQAGLNKQERLKNLRATFRVRNSQYIYGKSIALIDDVMTTRATAEVCAQALLNAGASRVDIWCLARTPKTKTLHS